jgi:hypothetical protein
VAGAAANTSVLSVSVHPVIGDRTRGPDGAAAGCRWVGELGLRYEEPVDSEDWMATIGPIAAQIERDFNQECVRAARHRHGLVRHG